MMAKRAARPNPDPREVPREHRPLQGRYLWESIRQSTGITIADKAVCAGHVAPWTYFEALCKERPSLALVLGPRGGGKSFLSALETHLTSRWNPGHQTRVLGGSKAQSAQIYEALRTLVSHGASLLDENAGTLIKLLKDEAIYDNGSVVKILAASSTSVRGPHVPSLKLDEVDEIDSELLEAAMGMCMNQRGQRASVVMTSTWHRAHGPMATLMERAKSGEFPFYSYCIFEVLEPCPEERSGPDYEHCPACPIVRWCHSDRDQDPQGRPKAKRSQGHYSIDALIQKVRAISVRTFEADYLSLGPKADGIWFPTFNLADHVSERAEYDPALPVYLAVDSGVTTGAVFFQITSQPTSTGWVEEVRVFADYLAENVPAEANGRALRELARTRCQGRIDVATTDPNGGSRNAVGPTVLAEYERGGLKLQPWRVGKVADGLALVESFVQPADGGSRLLIHPRCTALVEAMQHYRRARRGGQWIDEPEDPQHPHEDLVDALRGGLRARFPEGRRPQPNYARISARQVF
jgi:hypothetical protein